MKRSFSSLSTWRRTSTSSWKSVTNEGKFFLNLIWSRICTWF
jgi:hypothetical protein